MRAVNNFQRAFLTTLLVKVDTRSYNIEEVGKLRDQFMCAG